MTLTESVEEIVEEECLEEIVKLLGHQNNPIKPKSTYHILKLIQSKMLSTNQLTARSGYKNRTTRLCIKKLSDAGFIKKIDNIQNIRTPLYHASDKGIKSLEQYNAFLKKTNY